MSTEQKAMVYTVVPGRRVIFVTGSGKANAQIINDFTDSILEVAKAWKEEGWAYVADCSKVPPVTPEESEALIDLTKRICDAGCRVIAFVEGKAFMIKIQAMKHTENPRHTSQRDTLKLSPKRLIGWKRSSISKYFP